MIPAHFHIVVRDPPIHIFQTPRRFLALTLRCLACFSNTCFTLLLASRVASAPIPVSLQLGNGVVGLKYRQIPEIILLKKQLLKNNGIYSTTFHCCYTTQGWKHPLLLLFLEQLAMFIGSTLRCLLTTPTKSHPHKFNYCDLFFAMLSALAKFRKVTQNIISLR